jgi:hypothetical protein
MLPRQLIVLAVIVPVAAVVGYVLATPDTTSTFLLLGLVLATLTAPIFLRWHHPMLVFAWNATIHFILLPGQPALWMLFAFISLFISVLNRVMDRESPWLNVPAVTWPLLFIAFVVLGTVKLSGGLGLAALGSDTFGGKKVVFLVAGIVGYFALSSQPTPVSKANRYIGLFALSGLTGGLSNLIYMAGPTFYFLYYIIPTEFALSQAVEDIAGPILGLKLNRLTGVTFAGTAVFQYLMARYGIRGVMQKPLRAALLVAMLGLSTLGGFRSAIVLCGMVFVLQFFLEGLHRTRLLLVLGIAATIGGALLVPFAQRLPLSVQRAISFLPVDVDLAARADAQASNEWRLDMWRVVATQIPKYFWIGKGYAINPTDLYLSEESRRRGFVEAFDVSMISGDYHSGPLSVQIPFGIFGTLGLLWFLGASLWVLYRNYRFGDPALKTINTFLLSFFIARTIFYWAFYGSFNSDLAVFAGVIGLSVSLNGGMAKPPEEPAAAPA